MTGAGAEPPPHPRSIEQIGPALIGTGDIMAWVADCWTVCWYAARAGNLELASYYLRRVRGLLRRLSAIKPKYSEQLAEFDRGQLEAAAEALRQGDLAAFEAAFELASRGANVYHVETGHAYIVWRLPDRPPETGLELGPGESNR